MHFYHCSKLGNHSVEVLLISGLHKPQIGQNHVIFVTNCLMVVHVARGGVVMLILLCVLLTLRTEILGVYGGRTLDNLPFVALAFFGSLLKRTVGGHSVSRANSILQSHILSNDNK